MENYFTSIFHDEAILLDVTKGAKKSKGTKKENKTGYKEDISQYSNPTEIFPCDIRNKISEEKRRTKYNYKSINDHGYNSEYYY